MKPFYTMGLAAMLCMSSACASVDKGQRTVGVKATKLSSFEAMLDAESEKAEEELKRSGARIHDISLEAYVKNIAHDSAGEFADEVDVYLLKAPVFNAFMMPNGVMGVNSGLLLRLESEDELALVMGHEFGHYYEKHSLERHAAYRNMNKTINALSLTPVVGLAGLGAQLLLTNSLVAGLFSFSREQESAADYIGLKLTRKNGYDTGAAIRLWENLENEKNASSIRKIRKKHSSIYDTHPTNEDRLEDLKKNANIDGEIPRASRVKQAQYRARIRPHLMSWLEDEIELRDTGASLNLLDRLDDLGEDQGTLLYARARVIDRALSNKKLKKDKITQELMEGLSSQDTIELLKAASIHSDAPSIVHRDLGDRLYKSGEYKEAQSAFQRYLTLSPDAEDTLLIKSLIEDIKGLL